MYFYQLFHLKKSSSIEDPLEMQKPPSKNTNFLLTPHTSSPHPSSNATTLSLNFKHISPTEQNLREVIKKPPQNSLPCSEHVFHRRRQRKRVQLIFMMKIALATSTLRENSRYSRKPEKSFKATLSQCLFYTGARLKLFHVVASEDRRISSYQISPRA